MISGKAIGARVFTNKGSIKVVQASLRATSMTESGKLESTRFRKEVSNWQRENTFCPWPDKMPAAICWHIFLTQMREDTPQNKPTDDNPPDCHSKHVSLYKSTPSSPHFVCNCKNTCGQFSGIFCKTTFHLCSCVFLIMIG